MRRLLLNVILVAVLAISVVAAELPSADSRPAQLGILCTVHHGGSASASSTWLRVEQVAPGTAAERAGVRSGDIITALNGEPLNFRDEVDLMLAMAKLEVNKPATLAIARGKERQTITFLPTRMSASQYEQWKVGMAMLQAQRAQRAAAAAAPK